MHEEWKELQSPQVQYEHYEIGQETERGSLCGTPEPRKSSGISGKILQTVLLAVLFGVIAGGIALGMLSYGSRKLINEIQEVKKAQEVQEVQEVQERKVLLESTAGASESGTVADVAKSAMPSVVAITSVSIQEIPSFFGYGFRYGIREYPSTGSGSGIIVGENEEELLIATNNHVIEGAQTVSVCFIGNDVVNAEEETLNLASGAGDLNVQDAVTAKIKGTDEDNDLAVIAVRKADIPSDTMNEISIARIGSSDSLVVGEQVVAIGNALGYGQSVTSGWISALNRNVSTKEGEGSSLIQTDAAINPGNSGGALLNMKGELIGINSAKYADETVEGMGYAIPISKAKPILEELMNRKTREIVEDERAAYLGVQLANLSSDAQRMYDIPSGAFIVEVTEGGAAAEAGLRRGDIIIRMDGQKINGREDLIDKLQYYEAGETVEMVIERAMNGEYVEQSLEVTFGNRY